MVTQKKYIVKYIFPGTSYTTNELEWIWYDGKGSPRHHDELQIT